MKKIFFLVAAALLSAGVLTSCKDDTQPRLEHPTEFVLNTPPTANEIVVLQNGKGEGSTLEFTCSQPNYGLGTVTRYEVQVAESEDFADFQTLPTIGTQARIVCDAFEFSVACNALRGITEKEDEAIFTNEARQVWVRVKAFVNHCDYSEILSNPVCIWVKPFFAVRVPGKVYVIGDFEGWDINKDTYFVDETENGIGSNIYSGVFDIPAGKAMFRFYTVLGDWETNSLGYQVDDKATDFAWPNDDEPVFSTDVVAGKGAWNFPGWEGGKMKVTLDLNEMKVYFETVE